MTEHGHENEWTIATLPTGHKVLLRISSIEREPQFVARGVLRVPEVVTMGLVFVWGEGVGWGWRFDTDDPGRERKLDDMMLDASPSDIKDASNIMSKIEAELDRIRLQ